MTIILLSKPGKVGTLLLVLGLAAKLTESAVRCILRLTRGRRRCVEVR